MCADGTLGVNGYGYPVLILKIINCLLAGVWLAAQWRWFTLTAERMTGLDLNRDGVIGTPSSSACERPCGSPSQSRVEATRSLFPAGGLMSACHRAPV